MADKCIFNSSLSFHSKGHGEIEVEWAIYRKDGIFGQKGEEYPFGTIESVKFKDTGQAVDKYQHHEIMQAARSAVRAAYSLHRLEMILFELQRMLDDDFSSEFVSDFRHLAQEDCEKGFMAYFNRQLSYHLKMLGTISELGIENLNERIGIFR